MAAQGRSIELPLRSWTTFYHPRFHYELPIPPGVRAQGDPEAGAVATFISHDHQFAISAWSRHAPGSRAAQLEGEWRSALNKNGRMVTYQRKAASWFVVSGTDSTGVEFYEKSMVRGDQLAGFKLTYLHSLVSVFDPWVEKIEAGFVLVSNRRSAASVSPSGIETNTTPPKKIAGRPGSRTKPNAGESPERKPSDAGKDGDEPPIAEKVIGKPGFVYSPFRSNRTLVDVDGIPSGTKVKCPYTMKIFRVP